MSDTKNSENIRSRDDIVGHINLSAVVNVNAGRDIVIGKKPNFEDEYQIRRLVQVLRNMEGQFILLFAICSNPSKRQKLTREIERQLAKSNVIEITLARSKGSILDTLLAARVLQHL
ncbi:hypothetical protein HC928_24780 [bacterium]|nr:hypothetical protein [bacterium]